MHCLLDCANFYASCERLFRPDLRRRPLAVLSNNDGCVIAMSNEVKQLGVRLGAPHFQCRRQLAAAGAVVFSANFPLYGDMSARVMDCLRAHAGQVEVYSIDEAFFACDDPEPAQHLRRLSRLVWRWTGIPVNIGAGATRTLAKLASCMAKSARQGALVLADAAAADAALRSCEIGKVWGIGRNSAKLLRRQRVATALDFCRLDPYAVKTGMGVAGLRIWHELRGMPCPALDGPGVRRSVCHSRSFPRKIAEPEELAAAVRLFAARSAERLRGWGLAAGKVSVELTVAGAGGRARHDASATLDATSDSWLIMGRAEQLARRLYRPGRRYAKAAITLLELTAARQPQLALPDVPVDRGALLAGIDRLNLRYGKDTVRFGYRRWRPRQARLSPQYTTRKADVCPVA